MTQIESRNPVMSIDSRDEDQEERDVEVLLAFVLLPAEGRLRCLAHPGFRASLARRTERLAAWMRTQTALGETLPQLPGPLAALTEADERFLDDL